LAIAIGFAGGSAGIELAMNIAASAIDIADAAIKAAACIVGRCRPQSIDDGQRCCFRYPARQGDAGVRGISG
jgi:hypothetical protein